jgi:uncharacterized protein YndB with AHSA1/START domain
MRHPSERLISRPTSQAQRSNAERAILKLHTTSHADEIYKRVEPGGTLVLNLIADKHGHPLSFAKRSVSGNTVLVARLAKTLTVAAIQEFRSKQDAEKALRKLIGAADAE